MFLSKKIVLITFAIVFSFDPLDARATESGKCLNAVNMKFVVTAATDCT